MRRKVHRPPAPPREAVAGGYARRIFVLLTPHSNAMNRGRTGGRRKAASHGFRRTAFTHLGVDAGKSHLMVRR